MDGISPSGGQAGGRIGENNQNRATLRVYDLARTSEQPRYGLIVVKSHAFPVCTNNGCTVTPV